MERLGDICTIVSGSTPKSNVSEYWDGDVKWITPAELSEESYIINDTVRHITELGVAKTGLKPFPKGTVILSSRAPIGKTAIAGCEMYCNQGFKNLICSEKINPRYLYWFLTCNTEYLNSLGRGATFKEISKEIVGNIEIPLPKKEEQIAIAEKFEKLNDLISLRKQQLAKLVELVKARFVELFGDPVANEKGWPLATLGEVAEIRIGPFGTLLHKEDYIEGGHALVNPSHIIEGSICVDDKLTISDEKYKELSAYHLLVGDVVLGRRGEMGRCAVVYKEGLLCGTGSMVIRPSDKMKPYFLQNIISNPAYKKVIEDKAVGVTMMNLNVPIVSSLTIPLLPVEMQEKFIVFMQKTDKSKASVQESLDKLETLKKALMQKYFG